MTESDFDYADADKRLHLHILCMFAEYFSEKLSQHTVKGKRGRFDAGLHNGDLPHGYANPDKGADRSGAGVFNSSTPIIVETEAEAVRLAFGWYAAGGKSDAAIARDLTLAGHRIVSKWQPAGGPFGKDTISAMLKNPFYAGFITYTGNGETNRANGAERIKGRHPAIITEELFEAVQRVRQSRAPNRLNKCQTTQMKATYPLAGLLVCAHCGGSLRVQSAARGACFRCTAKERGKECDAAKHSILISAADRLIAEVIEELRLADDWRERATMAIGRTEERDQVEEERATIQRRLKKIRELVQVDAMTISEWQSEKAMLDDRLARLELPADVDLEAAGAFLAALPALWKDAHSTQEQRAGLCARLLTRVVCDLDRGVITAIHLREELAPLFAVIPPQVHTPSGSDGIRTRDILRDRQERPSFCGPRPALPSLAAPRPPEEPGSLRAV